MAQRWFADGSTGKPLGSFDGADPPDGAVETPQPPHGAAVWDGQAWTGDPVAPEPDKATVLADLLENESNDAAAWRQRYEQARDRVRGRARGSRRQR